MLEWDGLRLASCIDEWLRASLTDAPVSPLFSLGYWVRGRWEVWLSTKPGLDLLMVCAVQYGPMCASVFDEYCMPEI